MRSLCMLVVAATGCGFDLTPSPGKNRDDGGTVLDVSRMTDAVDVPPDAPPDASIDSPPPMWTVVDTIIVSCLNQPTSSTYVLLAGVTYQLRASGQCVSNDFNGSQGDAEYTYNPSVINDVAGGIDTGIAIDDATPSSQKQPRWGMYNGGTHQYEVPWVGTGAAIAVLFHDSNYSNNSGSLTLRILALQ